MKIVSLLPSATEMVAALGLTDALCGVTHECDYPPAVRGLPSVTRTLIPPQARSGEIDDLVRQRLRSQQSLYSLDLDVLRALQPDWIVTQSLCNVCAVAEDEIEAAVAELPGKPQVINLAPSSLEDVFCCLLQIGRQLGRPVQAGEVVAALRQRVDRVRSRSEAELARPGAVRPAVMVLEWIDPPFSAGHWTPELVQLAGGRELLGRAGERSQTLSWDAIRQADPEVMVIACCGFDVQRTMAELPLLRRVPELAELRCVRGHRVYVVDGSAYFSRPGPRLVDSLEILAHALHRQTHPLAAELQSAAAVAVDWRAC